MKDLAERFDIIIIGGGLAGLTCAIHLSQQNIKVLLIEKNEYPHHKVCGEYVSNEVLPYLQSLGVDPLKEGAKNITQFQISNHTGKKLESKLPLGGFGMSRYTLDNLLYEKAKETAAISFETVKTIDFAENTFTIITKEKAYLAEYVVGAYGKRSNIDKHLNRRFINNKAPWLAVKAHYKYEFTEKVVALHNFDGGYCGLSQVENGIVNACYLATFKSFQKYKDIEKFQEAVLAKNPNLDTFFSEAVPLFEKPLTISQISFEKKKPVEDHIFMIGDTAGLIHPLCGNGMAMAIHAAKLFSEVFWKNIQNKTIQRSKIEKEYALLWSKTFNSRLRMGSVIQKILLNESATKVGYKALQLFPSMVPFLIKKTHGQPLK